VLVNSASLKSVATTHKVSHRCRMFICRDLTILTGEDVVSRGQLLFEMRVCHVKAK